MKPLKKKLPAVVAQASSLCVSRVNKFPNAAVSSRQRSFENFRQFNGVLDCGGKAGAATPLSMLPYVYEYGTAHESGVALHFPPQSKTRAGVRLGDSIWSDRFFQPR